MHQTMCLEDFQIHIDWLFLDMGEVHHGTPNQILQLVEHMVAAVGMEDTLALDTHRGCRETGVASGTHKPGRDKAPAVAAVALREVCVVLEPKEPLREPRSQRTRVGDLDQELFHTFYVCRLGILGKSSSNKLCMPAIILR